ncbi:MAG: hypothetical protein WAW37_00330, partial [Syntrophobacteraceae bacterium]
VQLWQAPTCHLRWTRLLAIIAQNRKFSSPGVKQIFMIVGLSDSETQQFAARGKHMSGFAIA